MQEAKKHIPDCPQISPSIESHCIRMAKSKHALVKVGIVGRNGVGELHRVLLLLGCATRAALVI